MALINYSSIEDGTTIDAADVNTPLTTIYNDYNGNIDANNLADNAVTTAKITDANVTTAKLADSNVTSEKLKTTIGFYATTTQATTNSAVTDITTYTEVADYGSAFDHTTGVFTAPIAGLYHFDAGMSCVNIAATTDGRWEVFLYVGATLKARGFTEAFVTTADPSAIVSVTLPLAANNTVSLKVSNQTGGNEDLDAQSFFSGYLVGQV